MASYMLDLLFRMLGNGFSPIVDYGLKSSFWFADEFLL